MVSLSGISSGGSELQCQMMVLLIGSALVEVNFSVRWWFYWVDQLWWKWTSASDNGFTEWISFGGSELRCQTMVLLSGSALVEVNFRRWFCCVGSALVEVSSSVRPQAAGMAHHHLVPATGHRREQAGHCFFSAVLSSTLLFKFACAATSQGLELAAMFLSLSCCPLSSYNFVETIKGKVISIVAR